MRERHRSQSRVELTPRLNGLVAAHAQHVARVAFKYSTDRLEGVERNSLGLVFLQAPQRRVADAGFFRQPIKRSSTSFQ